MLGHLEGKYNVKDPSSSHYLASKSVATLLLQQCNKSVLEKFKKNLIRWVVTDDMAFSAIESPFFQQMINDIPGISIPFTSRNTLTSRIKAEFELDRQQLNQELAISSQTITLSLDGWTSNNDIPVLAVIGHWLTEDFVYKDAVLEFKEIEGAKSGENMARIVFELLHELDIKSKVLSITSDNTSNNETLVEEFHSSLCKHFAESLHAIRFHGQDSFIRCLAHVLNLIVKKILSTLKSRNRKSAEASIELVSQYRYLNTTDSALARLRVLAIWISWTPERKSQWRYICKDNNLPDTCILYDVNTRWNSTYLMLRAGIKAKRQISRWISLYSDIPQFTDIDWSFYNNLLQYYNGSMSIQNTFPDQHLKSAIQFQYIMTFMT